MLGEEHALAYARADFAEPHQRFVTLLCERLPALPARGAALDLGCGPADVTIRTARALAGWSIDGLDGSPAMLRLGREAVAAAGLAERISLLDALLPGARAPRERYDLVFSNSLLHHLADPLVLWREIARFAAPGAPCFVMDLARPDSPEAAQRLTAQHAAGAPPILQRDFLHSLHAAYQPDEVRAQIAAAGLAPLAVELVSDRHWIAWGVVAPR